MRRFTGWLALIVLLGGLGYLIYEDVRLRSGSSELPSAITMGEPEDEQDSAAAESPPPPAAARSPAPADANIGNAAADSGPAESGPAPAVGTDVAASTPAVGAADVEAPASSGTAAAPPSPGESAGAPAEADVAAAATGADGTAPAAPEAATIMDETVETAADDAAESAAVPVEAPTMVPDAPDAPSETTVAAETAEPTADGAAAEADVPVTGPEADVAAADAPGETTVAAETAEPTADAAAAEADVPVSETDVAADDAPSETMVAVETDETAADAAADEASAPVAEPVPGDTPPETNVADAPGEMVAPEAVEREPPAGEVSQGTADVDLAAAPEIDGQAPDQSGKPASESSGRDTMLQAEGEEPPTAPAEEMAIAAIDPNADVDTPATAPDIVPPAAEVDTAASVPSFDVVRVEPTGDAVVAGVAPPGATVELMDGTETLATVVASPSGDWALALEEPLPAGQHDLAIRATSEDDQTVVESEQRVVVLVPEESGEEPLVVLNAPDAPSAVLQLPAPRETDIATLEPPVDADAAGHADGRLEDGRDAVGAGNDRGDVDEGDIGAGLLAGPQRNVVDAGHAGGADAHGALFGDQHDALARVLQLQSLDFLLRGFGDHALAVQLAVGAGMGLVAGRQEVGGNIAFGGDIGNDLDLVLDVRKLGEELGLGIAFQDVPGDFVAGLIGGLQPGSVRVIEEHLGLQDFGGVSGDRLVVAKRQVEQNFHGRTALHVGEQLEGEGRRDFRYFGAAENDFLQELRLGAGCARRAGQGVVDEEVERVRPVFVRRILDLGDDLLDQGTVLDGLRMQALAFAGLDLF